ncbi:hypothetical protein GCM10020000_26860 [Streptomyces olivoverticillatus]
MQPRAVREHAEAQARLVARVADGRVSGMERALAAAVECHGASAVCGELPQQGHGVAGGEQPPAMVRGDAETQMNGADLPALGESAEQLAVGEDFPGRVRFVTPHGGGVVHGIPLATLARISQGQRSGSGRHYEPG